ncbi:HlyD family efflux transporter periplasmic adaptor subunit [Pseudomonas sp. sp1636]|uniref:efflux RND transporter periplasmic adaptor subunit n=1 Tax=Pseudomonas sp. sp1636 TaxID=3036707 RepID=UPI0025A6621E|nr:HlyD family efflux transporter periplasmic adaptor subunit [Pseudomonas sp. sp1636]MDM8351125.1 HlyD family efflux transporter periplasmic adaptor subunit [Pseudomonas sp. sp1636]
MSAFEPGTREAAGNPLLALLDLGHRARGATSPEELAFLLVNDTRALVAYRQAALWFADGGVRSLSGVVQPENNAPYVQWLNRLSRSLTTQADAENAARLRPIDREALHSDVAEQWAEWWPGQALWLPIMPSASQPGSCSGGLLLAGDQPFSEDTQALLNEWMHTWRHAWFARSRPPAWPRSLLRRTLTTQPSAPWWRRRSMQLGLLLLLTLFLPVRLTVLAPGQLVPADPAVIRAPLDGVIGQFHVQPNAEVKAGQLLFTFDEAAIISRLEVARQTLSTAEAKYRQFAQMAVNDNTSKAQLAVLVGEINEKHAEVEFLQSQLERSRVLAPRDGVVLVDDLSEWVGRPVQTGERVMRLATPSEVEIEVWLGIGDAIPVAEQAPVRLYLAATPFASIPGQVRYLAHDAVPRPDGSYAYRMRATLEQGATGRIGLKGTAKVYGDWVTLGYWILRRPLATIRQFVAL